MTKAKTPTTAAFVSQKGGVGKSTLARLLAVGAIHRGRKTLLADFDLDQLTCVEWGALRMRAGLEPEVDTRAFKSLKKLRREDGVADFIVADTRGLADDLSTEIAEDSEVVFLPTGVSGDDLRPTLALARRLARRGVRGRACCRRLAARDAFRRRWRDRGRRPTSANITAARRLPADLDPDAPAARRATLPARGRRADGGGSLGAYDEGEAQRVSDRSPVASERAFIEKA
jgi:hypothetical protein